MSNEVAMAISSRSSIDSRESRRPPPTREDQALARTGTPTSRSSCSLPRRIGAAELVVAANTATVATAAISAARTGVVAAVKAAVMEGGLEGGREVKPVEMEVAV